MLFCTMSDEADYSILHSDVQRSSRHCTRRLKLVVASCIGCSALLALVLQHSRARTHGSLFSSMVDTNDHVCNCPPSYALWKCSKRERTAELNGSSCPYYRPHNISVRRSELDVRAKLFLSFPGIDAEQADYECNCPPSFAVYKCSRTQYRELVSGATCLYYKNANAAMAIVTKTHSPMVLVGSDIDAQGCIVSAGYSWCPARGACIRPWEFNISSVDQLVVFCSTRMNTSQTLAEIGGDRDWHGCIASAGYNWCPAREECVRPWDHAVKSVHDWTALCSKAVQSYSDAQPGKSCILSAGYTWCPACVACIRPWEHDIFSVDQLNSFCSPEAAANIESTGGAGFVRDSHGCMTSAGYSWCAGRYECIRPWELNITSTQDLEAACSEKAVQVVSYGSDRDAHGCIPSAGYRWCAVVSDCIRPWDCPS